ncbi:unnamed protein product [Urochloa humidicola]
MVHGGLLDPRVSEPRTPLPLLVVPPRWRPPRARAAGRRRGPAPLDAAEDPRRRTPPRSRAAGRRRSPPPPASTEPHAIGRRQAPSREGDCWFISCWLIGSESDNNSIDIGGHDGEDLGKHT